MPGDEIMVVGNEIVHREHYLAPEPYVIDPEY